MDRAVYPNLRETNNFPRSVEVTGTAFIEEVYSYAGEYKIALFTILLPT